MPCDCNSQPNPKQVVQNSDSSKPDLTTSDWLIFSTEKMIKRINSNIVTRKGTNGLTVKNISSDDLKKISLFTHNSTNNNYLSLDSIHISLNTGVVLLLPGLKEIVTEIYKDEDNIANTEDQKFFQPFVYLDELVDKFTFIVPFYPKLAGKEKYYTLKFIVN